MRTSVPDSPATSSKFSSLKFHILNPHRNDEPENMFEDIRTTKGHINVCIRAV